MKKISSKQAAALIKENSSVMMGGFMGCGSAHHTIDALVAQGTKNLHLISSDTAKEDFGCGKLIANKQIATLIASHIGTNKETGRQMTSGELKVTLVPQGTLAERIRAGGSGLGGVLVPTGLGTDVEQGKDIISVDGKQYLLEKPLRADVALIYATYADCYGNLAFDGTTRNFNPLMALAADIIIAEVEEILSTALDPNAVVIPTTLVNYVVDIKE